MVIFTDKRSPRQRVIVETDQGRVEILVPRTADTARVLRTLETEIESGAVLVLEPTKARRNGIGSGLLLTEYQIRQSAPVSGSLVARTRTAPKAGEKAIARIRDIFGTSFRFVRDSPEKGNRVLDYVIDVKRRVNEEEPGWEVMGSIVIDDAGMRFVLHLVPGPNPIEAIGG